MVGGAGGSHPPRPGRWIPVADVPVEPVLSATAFLPQRGPGVPAIVDTGTVLRVTAGRYAIALALRHMGLAPGDGVMVPAYHCSAMIEPILAAGGRPVFYRVRPDLSVDLPDIATRIDATTRALMITHYFGFAQNGEAIAAFCRSRGLVLLEDCAHSFFGSRAGQPLGTFGSYAIGSPRKFFAVPDGGCLVIHATAGQPLAPLRRPGVLQAARQMLGFVDLSVDYGRLQVLAPMLGTVAKLRGRGRPAVAALPPPDPAPDPQISDAAEVGFFEFDPALTTVRMNPLSDLVVRTTARSRVVRLRRANYRILSRALAELPGCRALFAALPDETVPYLFPLWVDQLDEIFPLLEDQAVPMQRFGQFLWPGVDEDLCPVSAALARHVVQFPCHQDLRTDEIDSICTRVRTAVLAVHGKGGLPARMRETFSQVFGSRRKREPVTMNKEP